MTAAGQSRPSTVPATLLSLLLPGLGHVYAGQTVVGVAFYVGELAAFAGCVALLASRPFALVGIPAVLLGFRAAAAIHARRAARAADTPGPGAALIVAAAVLFAVAGRATLVVSRMFIVEAYKIPSGSMMPTLLVGDHLFVDKGSFEPARGDLIVFEYPPKREQHFISRVVGVSGDRIEVLEGHLTINGVRVPRCEVGRADDELTLFVEWFDDRAHLILQNDRAEPRRVPGERRAVFIRRVRPLEPLLADAARQGEGAERDEERARGRGGAGEARRRRRWSLPRPRGRSAKIPYLAFLQASSSPSAHAFS